MVCGVDPFPTRGCGIGIAINVREKLAGIGEVLCTRHDLAPQFEWRL